MVDLEQWLLYYSRVLASEQAHLFAFTTSLRINTYQSSKVVVFMQRNFNNLYLPLANSIVCSIIQVVAAALSLQVGGAAQAELEMWGWPIDKDV
jgi:hypothetical protein